jgi:hypothetical protein
MLEDEDDDEDEPLGRENGLRRQRTGLPVGPRAFP